LAGKIGQQIEQIGARALDQGGPDARRAGSFEVGPRGVADVENLVRRQVQPGQGLAENLTVRLAAAGFAGAEDELEVTVQAEVPNDPVEAASRSRARGFMGMGSPVLRVDARHMSLDGPCAWDLEPRMNTDVRR